MLRCHTHGFSAQITKTLTMIQITHYHITLRTKRQMITPTVSQRLLGDFLDGYFFGRISVYHLVRYLYLLFANSRYGRYLANIACCVRFFFFFFFSFIFFLAGLQQSEQLVELCFVCYRMLGVCWTACRVGVSCVRECLHRLVLYSSWFVHLFTGDFSCMFTFIDSKSGCMYGSPPRWGHRVFLNV